MTVAIEIKLLLLLLCHYPGPTLGKSSLSIYDKVHIYIPPGLKGCFELFVNLRNNKIDSNNNRF